MMSGLATLAGTDVVSPHHSDESRGVRNGTPMSTRRLPSSRANVSSISRYVTMSGPPTSITVRCSSSGMLREADRYDTTSSMAIGCERVSTHRGTTITGSRCTRSDSMRNEALCTPTTIAALSSTSGGPSSASTRPVSWRLDRCWESAA